MTKTIDTQTIEFIRIHKKKISIILVIVLLALATGIPQFVLFYAGCGFKPPVQLGGAVINYGVGYSVVGDRNYGPHFLNGYVCSVDKAKSMGLTPEPGSRLEE